MNCNPTDGSLLWCEMSLTYTRIRDVHSHWASWPVTMSRVLSIGRRTATRVSMAPSPQRPLGLISLALWCGLFAGYLEFAACRLYDVVSGETRQQSLSAIWLMPLVNAILFVGAGVALAGLVKWTRWPWAARWSRWLIVLATFLSLTAVTDQIHGVAWLILACGLATVATRKITEHADHFARFARRSFRLFSVLIILSSLWTLIIPRWHEERTLSQLPGVTKPQPNVLLVVLDTVPAKRLSPYGYHRPTTPFLKQLASESTLFEHAYATAPWTLPSHASIFTGRQSYELLTDYETPLRPQFPTLAKKLGEVGYATAGFVANWHYCVPEFGLNRGFVHYDGPRSWSSRVLLASFWSSRGTRVVYHRLLGGKDHLGRKNAAMINAEFLHWLDRRPERPFFAFLNYMDTHTAYLPPRRYQRRFGSQMPSDPGLHKYWYDSGFKYSSEERQQIVDAYDGCLAYLDDQLAELFAQLKRRKLDENTLVIVVGDHGEMLGEHDLFEHANCLYSEVVQVPLMLRFPGRVPSGQRATDAVSIADIPATVADLLSLPDSPFPGVSLIGAGRQSLARARRPVYFEVKRNPFAQVRRTPASEGDMQGVIAGGMHYIQNADGREEVYDIENDPEQRSNLNNTELGRAAVERSRRIVKRAERRRPRENT
jgi:arylsulfatase A-like enzyme